MADTKTAEPKEKPRDVTKVWLEAQGNIPLRWLKTAGVKFSEDNWQELHQVSGARRIERGVRIRVEQYIADELMKKKVKSIRPMARHKSIPAFKPATGE